MQAAAALLELKKITTVLQFNGKKIEITKNRLISLSMAYKHYMDLLSCHLKMVLKDIQTDIAEFYGVSCSELIYYSTFGEKAFSVDGYEIVGDDIEPTITVDV